MANISDFKSQLLYGGARPNHFECIINFPSTMTGTGMPEHISYMAKAASLPASSVVDIPVMYRGREIHVAGERTFAPWTVTIINDVYFGIRSQFEIWSNMIQRYHSTEAHVEPASYKADMQVWQLNRMDDKITIVDPVTAATETKERSPQVYGYYFIGAYPIEVGEIGLSYDINNAIEEFPVTFVYDFFIPNQPTFPS